MEITEEIKEIVEELFKDNPEIKEKILSGDRDVIRNLGLVSQKNIDLEIVSEYCKKGKEEELYEKAKQLRSWRDLYGLIVLEPRHNVHQEEYPIQKIEEVLEEYTEIKELISEGKRKFILSQKREEVARLRDISFKNINPRTIIKYYENGKMDEFYEKVKTLEEIRRVVKQVINPGELSRDDSGEER